LLASLSIQLSGVVLRDLERLLEELGALVQNQARQDP